MTGCEGLYLWITRNIHLIIIVLLIMLLLMQVVNILLFCFLALPIKPQSLPLLATWDITWSRVWSRDPLNDYRRCKISPLILRINTSCSHSLWPRSNWTRRILTWNSRGTDAGLGKRQYPGVRVIYLGQDNWSSGSAVSIDRNSNSIRRKTI